MDQTYRVQIVADMNFIQSFEEVTQDGVIEVQRKEIDSTDQKFGLVEVGALIATFHAVATLAEKIVDVWAKTRRPIKVTVTTPKGSITVEGDAGKSVDDVIAELKPVVA